MSWIYALAAMGVAFVLLSLLSNVVASFSLDADPTQPTLKNYRELLGDGRVPAAFARTVILGVGSVAVMIAWSVPLCWLLARTDFRWKRSLFLILTAKLAIPGRSDR